MPVLCTTRTLAALRGCSEAQARRWLATDLRSIRIRIGRGYGCLGASLLALLRAREGAEPAPTASRSLLDALMPRTRRGRNRRGCA